MENKNGWPACHSTLEKQIIENESIILEKWHLRLKNEVNYRLDSECLETSDPLCNLDLLKDLVKNRYDPGSIDLTPLVERVRLHDFSISDMFMELSSLKSAIREVLWEQPGSRAPDILKAYANLGQGLDEVFKRILQHTSLFYELSIEKGITGFCQLNNAGRIIYANPTMVALSQMENVNGVSFDLFFTGAQKKEVQDVLQAEGQKEMIRALQWRTHKGAIIPVGLELSTVFLGKNKIGSYAKITNLEVPMAEQNRVFDEFPIGIVRLDQNRSVSYTNQFFRDLLGLDCQKWQGMDFRTLLPKDDEENARILENQLKERYEGESGEYEIKLRRIDDDRTIPVKISASPEKDLTGCVTGTMGIVRTIVRENMLEIIEKRRDPARLLKEIARELLGALPFDSFYLALFSPDARHVRNFFTYSRHQEPHTDRKWWVMTRGMREWASRKTIQTVPDVKAFYKKPEFSHLAEDPFIQYIIREYNSFIYYPVFKESKVVACAVIYSKSEKRYGPAHKRLMKYLPLKAAILSAIHYDKMDTLRFNVGLIKEISSLEDDITGIARAITRAIAKEYNWENVSVFRADRNKREFRLLHQEAVSETFRIKEGSQPQPLDKGVLGRVFREKKAINIGDVHSPDWDGIYIPTVEATRSEMSIPIQSGDLFWILNCEDSTAHAFSRQEQEQMEDLIKEMGVFLERAWLRSFLTQSVRVTSDAVIQTDFGGTITMVNQATLSLLGYDRKEPSAGEGLVGKPFSEILLDRTMADFIIAGDNIPNTPVSFRTRSGSYVRVLLSKFRLHEEFSTNIIIAKDLSAKERLEELQYLKKLYSEIAFQTKTPITLVSTWLKKIQGLSSTLDLKEISQKAGRQLRSLELTFDRLALFDKDQTETAGFPFVEMPLDMGEIRAKLGENIPRSELERVHFDLGEKHPTFMGDLFQICFCFETILSYLFRSVSDDERILFVQREKGAFLQFEISGTVPMLSSGKKESAHAYTLSRTLMDMALAEPVIRQFVANHGGRFERPELRDNRILFHLSLPLV